MGLCLSYIDHKNGDILVCADTRISYLHGEEVYCVAGNFSKLRRFGDKVIHIHGLVNVAEAIFNQIKDDSSFEQISEKAREVVRNFKDNLPNVEFTTEICVFSIIDGVATIHKMNDENDFKAIKFINDLQNIFAIGLKNNEALRYVENLYNSDDSNNKAIDDAFYETMVHFSKQYGEYVGGYMQGYIITKDGIQSANVSIPEDKELKQIKTILFSC
ncbi:hypothetical protein SD70_26050 [Gordoniibacillus kamchatkensis]|uniref:Uncharacterized protein n=2 Tax=Gordoniibacillus kamchatkensis TaxID=1590651 RepID=A0ABR5ABS0_9BACL|nr:hypothetical protein SD70_26050 [Paenibacillus sp. VKM B-2647]